MKAGTSKRGLAIAAAIALAVGVSTATDVDAQGRGRPSAGKPSGWHGGGHGWGGGHGGHWRGGHGGHGRHYGHGHWNHGHWHHGHWGHGHGYWYPGWTLGLGVGIGLAYPWWSYGYWPRDYVVVDRVVVDRPVGYVVSREGAFESAPRDTPGTRWYCPSPAGYYPEVRDCPDGWLRVVPDSGPPPAPATPPASTAPAPRSDARDELPMPSIAPGTLGSNRPARIAAPRMDPPAQLARDAGATRLAAK